MNKSFKLVEKSKIFFLISAVIIIVGIVLLCIPKVGLNLGLDFTEGATVQITLNTTPSDKDVEYTEKVEKFIEEKDFEVESTRQTSAEGKAILQFNLNYTINGKEVESDVFAKALENDDGTGLIADLTEFINDPAKITIDGVDEGVEAVSGITHSFTSPDATKSLTKRAFIAIAIAIVAMLIYIAFRFKLSSGIAAVIVLCHDVFVMITLTSIFRITVNTTFIAAVITVVGYSINATIIVFDRIKENLAKYKDKGLSDVEIANISVKETLRRTIFTTVTTLVMIGLIAILGVSTIKEFALPIIFGLLSGVYSAIALASCVWVQIRKLGAKISPKKSSYQKHSKEKDVKAEA